MAHLILRHGIVVDSAMLSPIPHVVGVSEIIPAAGLRSLSVALKRTLPVTDYEAVTIDDISGIPMLRGELLQYVTGISRSYDSTAEGPITENINFTTIIPNSNVTPEPAMAWSGISNEYAPPNPNVEPVFLEPALTTPPIAPITNELLDQWSMI